MAREVLQRELEKQKQNTYIEKYTDKIARRDSVINELRAQMNFTDVLEVFAEERIKVGK